MTKGQIYKIHSDFYYVDSGSEKFECKIREVLKKRKEKIFVGDYVEFSQGVITNILPRRNYIARPSVANIDQVIIVSALKQPDLDLHQLNRYIALAKYYNVQTILCFNKEDLEDEPSANIEIVDIYKPLGFKILFTSALENCGIKEFEEVLKGKVSVLCGNSGVGKSSLINAINPDFKLRTKSVSEKTQRGTHTTRHCEIMQLSEDAFIVDTPGFSNVRFDFILPQDVDLLFDDIKIYRDECKYKDCLHITEDGCNVLENLDKIADSRYASYLEFIEEAKDYKERVKYEGRKVETSKKTVQDKEIAKISERKRQSSRNTLKQKMYQQYDFENNSEEY